MEMRGNASIVMKKPLGFFPICSTLSQEPWKPWNAQACSTDAECVTNWREDPAVEKALKTATMDISSS